MSHRDPALHTAYEQCRTIHREYGRTFYLATRLLPRDRQHHVHALYAFARVSDEIVDSPAPQADSRVELLAWSQRAHAALHADTPPAPLSEPVLAATWDTLRTCRLDPDLIDEFVGSMQLDLTVTRYATWDDLRGYMRGSAAVIGELMAPILGGHSAQARAHAACLGEAFQLTNFIRDIHEDYLRGRIYLPQADLARFGVNDDDIANAVRLGRASDGLRQLVAFEIARARTLYAQAAPGVAQVEWWARPCLRVASRLYGAILEEVEAAGLDVFKGRAVVSRSRRLSGLTRAGRRLPHERAPATSRSRS